VKIALGYLLLQSLRQASWFTHRILHVVVLVVTDGLAHGGEVVVFFPQDTLVIFPCKLTSF
jgi:hypothetical protein